MNDEKLKMRLPGSREKLQQIFPQDNRGDLRITFGSKCFKLQKAFLRLESGYFKKISLQVGESLEIKENFNEDCFYNTMKCFYGGTLEISRNEVFQYFPIIKFLELESLLKFIRDDIAAKAEYYDIFLLMQLAHKYDEQEIFETCLLQLEKESFEQLRYAKHELLKCPLELFKLIIKTHNRARSQPDGKGISFSEINNLIKQYSAEKRMDEQELKFQLIDKNSLTAQEYKEIFLNEAKKKSFQSRSMIKLTQQPQPNLYISGFGNNLLSASKLTESVIEPFGKSTNIQTNTSNRLSNNFASIMPNSNDLTLEMERQFEKKVNAELEEKNAKLKEENKLLTEELNRVKQQVESNKAVIEGLVQSLNVIKEGAIEKERQDKQQKNIISKLEKVMNELKKQLFEKGQSIKKLEDRLTKLEKLEKKGGATAGKKYINYMDEADESKTVQSQIVPGNLLKNMMVKQQEPHSAGVTTQAVSGNFSKKPSIPEVQQTKPPIMEEELDEEELEELYASRLGFDIEPSSTPKKFLPRLASFLTFEGFQKKQFTLIYKRDANKPNELFGKPQDLKSRTSLLVLLQTKMNINIGGFITVSIGPYAADYLADDQAMLFSLTKNQKFSIKKTATSEAIFMSENYLICFGNDLMISKDCLKENSQCSWPSSYEAGSMNPTVKKGSKWLTGEDNHFSIKSLEIYEVEEGAMEMVI